MSRIRELFRRNGIWAVFLVYRLAVNRISLVFIRWMTGVPDIYFQGTPRIIGMRYIHVGRNFQCGRGAWIEVIEKPDEDEDSTPRLSIGDNVVASEYLHVAAVNGVRIGDNVLIGSGVLITDHAHGRYGRTQGDLPATPPGDRALSSKGKVTIGRNVWIADGVKVLPGVTIGEGSIIGANSVVAEDVPSNSIYTSGGAGRIVKVFNYDRHEWHTPPNE